jgi:hypothetical protein
VPEKRTHDYVRHGTTTLFAALEIATCKGTGRCFQQHTTTLLGTTMARLLQSCGGQPSPYAVHVTIMGSRYAGQSLTVTNLKSIQVPS